MFNSCQGGQPTWGHAVVSNHSTPTYLYVRQSQLLWLSGKDVKVLNLTDACSISHLSIFVNSVSSMLYFIII
jgi:hypothetical protein